MCCLFYFFFFFNDTATTEIYTLSLHDALPISVGQAHSRLRAAAGGLRRDRRLYFTESRLFAADRKSTRLNSSHANISYAVFCLKKKKLRSSPMFLIVTHRLLAQSYTDVLRTPS